MSTSVLFYEDESLRFFEKSIRLADLVRDGEGPAYVYHKGLLASRFNEMRAAFPKARIHFAMKANSHRDVLKTLKGLGAGADVVSAGEIERALECGFAPADIIYSGVGKTEKDINRALEVEIAQFNVESMSELARIGRLARARRTKARVAWRLNPDVDVKTHPYIATGLAENKFGLELARIPELEKIQSEFADSLELAGISLHLGSQMTELTGLREALRRLKPVYRELAAKFPSVKIFDVGGGLGISYETEQLAAESKLLREYAALIQEEIGDLGAEWQLEPGRWIVAHAGVLLTQVQYVKPTSERTFVVVDTGMNHLIRPALYGAYHSLLPLREGSSRSWQAYDVVGPICESADFLAKQRRLPELREGEWLAIADTGAYGYSMANVYNLQDLPREIVVGESRGSIEN